MPTTITVVPGTDTVNQMRIAHNDNDEALKVTADQAAADVAAHKAAGNTDHDGRYAKITDLDTHKVSGDHDGRYYTESEIDATVVKVTGDQEVAGKKTLTSSPVVKNATASTEYQDASGNATGRVLSVVANGTDRLTRLQAYKPSAGAYVDVIRGYAEDGSADSDLVLYSKGKRLATVEELQDRVRSGFFAMNASIYTADLEDLGSSDYHRAYHTPGGLARPMTVPEGAVLKAMSFLVQKSSLYTSVQREVLAPTAFSAGGYRSLWVGFRPVDVSGIYYLYVVIDAMRWNSATSTFDLTRLVDYDTGIGVTLGTAVAMDICLEFSR